MSQPHYVIKTEAGWKPQCRSAISSPETPPMSEIEKAREALFTHMLSVQAADDFLRKFESFSRAIAREEIEAAAPWVCGACGAVPSPTCPHRGVAPLCGVLVRAGDQEAGDKSPPAVEAPAAGHLQPLGGITIRADEPNIVTEGLGMTALARRLAEALERAWFSGEPSAHEREVERALAEARKHKLIE